MPRSLAARFFVASLLLLPLLLGASAYMLNLAFKNSLLSGEKERLKTHVYLLLGAANVSDGELFMPEVFQEPRFNQLDSGLYGYIHIPATNYLWGTTSTGTFAQQPELNIASSITPGASQFIEDVENGELFGYTYDIAWEDDNSETLMRVSILNSKDMFSAELSSYQTQLWQWLGSLAALLLLGQAMVLRWGLRPLSALAGDLKNIESGQNSQLEGDYPTEIQAVTDNLNQVLRSEHQQRERYRNTLDDLAHSLKTPLAIIQGSREQDSTEISAQVERMNQIIGHQLTRAAAHSHSGIPGKAIALHASVERLIHSLAKIYGDKITLTEVHIDTSHKVAVDERDLLEILGNVMENAFKYGHSRVHVSSSRDNDQLEIAIDDDGPGIATEKREVILQRGARADTATSGQGIGLAIATDIISGYGGSLRIEESPLGGARFVVGFSG